MTTNKNSQLWDWEKQEVFVRSEETLQEICESAKKILDQQFENIIELRFNLDVLSPEDQKIIWERIEEQGMEVWKLLLQLRCGRYVQL